jgi:ATP adenylyltransferase
MDHLYTPWRRDYIQTTKADGCVFCNAIKMQDSEALVVVRAEYSFVILNRYPYTNGHLMVVPYEHVDTLEALTQATRAEMMELQTRAMGVLRAVYAPQGFNLGGNIGSAAGAGIAEHVHLHILPRWAGDTNFMTAVGNTRILPELIEDTWKRIQEKWDK